MSGASLVVLGTGSLAHATCDALAAVSPEPVEVTVVGRDQAKAAAACYLAGTRAALHGTGMTFRPAARSRARGRPRRHPPRGCLRVRVPPVAVGADELRRPPGRTCSRAPGSASRCRCTPTSLPRRAGLVAAHSPGAWLVNACFPDAVNPVLAALGIPVLCGIGNVGTLAASAQAALGLPDQRRLRLLAHHTHLHAPHDPADEARAWLDGSPLPDVTGPARRPARHRPRPAQPGHRPHRRAGPHRAAHRRHHRHPRAGPERPARRLPGPARRRPRDAAAPGRHGPRPRPSRSTPGPAGPTACGSRTARSTSNPRSWPRCRPRRRRSTLRRLRRGRPAPRVPRPAGPARGAPHPATRPHRPQRRRRDPDDHGPGRRHRDDRGARVGRNLLLDYLELMPRSIAACVADPGAVTDDPAAFSPGFALPEPATDVREFYAAATAGLALARRVRRPPAHPARPRRQPGHPHHEDVPVAAHRGPRGGVHPPHRRAGDDLLADLGEQGHRAARRGAAGHRRAASSSPSSCAWWSSRRGPAGTSCARAGCPPTPGCASSTRCCSTPAPSRRPSSGSAASSSTGTPPSCRRRHGTNLWFSLALPNYLVADTARAYFEQDADPTDAAGRPRLHAHAVSSAFGLLGYHRGRTVLERDGRASAASRPATLLVQHLATSDMVLSLRHGGFDRDALPGYRRDAATGLFRQDADEPDPHFPATLHDPDEVLDPTFYTRRPADLAGDERHHRPVRRRRDRGVAARVPRAVPRDPGPARRPRTRAARGLPDAARVVAGDGDDRRVQRDRPRARRAGRGRRGARLRLVLQRRLRAARPATTPAVESVADVAAAVLG